VNATTNRILLKNLSCHADLVSASNVLTEKTLKQVQGDHENYEFYFNRHAELVSVSNVLTEKTLKQVQGDP
jgi:hypothetical protein